MPKSIELTGNVFGRLTVVKVVDKYTRSGGQFYECKCDCGKIKNVGYRHLTRGNTISCGCLNRENGLKKVNNMKYFKGTQIEVITKNTVKKNNKTGINGVYFDKRLKKYIAKIKVKRVSHHLGCYEKLEDASKARQKAEEKYFKPIIEEFKSNTDKK